MHVGLSIRRLLSMAGVSVALLSVPAHAQDQRLVIPGFDVPACEGTISTFPLGNIPADAFYWVDIFDRTDEALAFRETFLKALRDDGRRTNQNGRLEFSFESASAFLGLVPRSGIDQAQRGAGAARDPGGEVGVSELRDTIRESRGGERRTRTSLGQQLGVKAELRDAETGKVIWLATLDCRPLTGDRALLSRFISKVVVQSLGSGSGKTAF